MLAALSLLAFYGLGTANVSSSSAPTPQPKPATLIPIAAATNNSKSINHNIQESNEEITEEANSNTIKSATSKTVASRTSTQLRKDSQAPSLSKSITSNAVNNQGLNQRSNNNRILLADATSLTKKDQGLEQALTSTTTSPEPPSKQNAVGLSIASIVMDELPIIDLTEFESALPALPFGPKVICEDFRNGRGWTFAVRAFAGPGTVIQNFNSTDQTAAYESLRDSVEIDQLSVNAGLRFEAVNRVGLFLRAGADYQMYRTNVESLGPPNSRTIIDSVFMEDTQTWRVETRNEVFQEQRDVYNRQHSVALTAGIGYRPTFGNVSPYIMAEAGYEFLFKKRGTFILPDGNFVDLADDDDDLYINDRPGFQFGGVIGVDFAITSQIELGLSAHYKRLGGFRGSADLLDFDQSTAFGALNLRYTIGGF